MFFAKDSWKEKNLEWDEVGPEFVFSCGKLSGITWHSSRRLTARPTEKCLL